MLTSIWRKAAAAVVGMAALVSAAQAQQVAPAPMPTNPAVPAVVPQALPATAPPAAAAPLLAPAAPAAGPALGCATGDCGGGCGAASGKHRLGDKYGIGVGTASPVGCGCWKSEWTFLAGSCRQFWSPGRTCCGEPTLYQGCGGYCGGWFAKHNGCPPPQYAEPYGRKPNNCAGPYSYQDR
jgi:hypothetical protein